MWLRDWLGQDLAKQQLYARVLTYGYSSKVAESDSDASLHDYGQELLQAIRLSRAKWYKVSSPHQPYYDTCRAELGTVRSKVGPPVRWCLSGIV
jgi:hypothetical protein